MIYTVADMKKILENRPDDELLVTDHPICNLNAIKSNGISEKLVTLNYYDSCKAIRNGYFDRKEDLLFDDEKGEKT